VLLPQLILEATHTSGLELLSACDTGRCVLWSPGTTE